MREDAPNARIYPAALCVFAALLCVVGSFAPPAKRADMAKTFHVVNTSAEMIFDTQFSAHAGSDGKNDHKYD